MPFFLQFSRDLLKDTPWPLLQRGKYDEQMFIGAAIDCVVLHLPEIYSVTLSIWCIDQVLQIFHIYFSLELVLICYKFIFAHNWNAYPATLM